MENWPKIKKKTQN